jgi:hypothetical protein
VGSSRIELGNELDQIHLVIELLGNVLFKLRETLSVNRSWSFPEESKIGHVTKDTSGD